MLDPDDGPDAVRYEFLCRIVDDATYQRLRKEATDADHFDRLVDAEMAAWGVPHTLPKGTCKS